MNWIHMLAAVVVGGALGGMARYRLSGLVGRRFGETFPWGTLAVNVSGALCIGVVGALIEDRGHTLWFWAVYGFLGSYTTVSSFSLQTLELARAGESRRALANIILSTVCCLAAAGAGFWLGRIAA